MLTNMLAERKSGLLLHPTSLPGRYGVGSFNQAAYEWVDFLARTRQSLWQVLPLGPTGYGDSPYQSFSSFAGNPYLISLEDMVEEGLLEQAVLRRHLSLEAAAAARGGRRLRPARHAPAAGRVCPVLR